MKKEVEWSFPKLNCIIVLTECSSGPVGFYIDKCRIPIILFQTFIHYNSEVEPDQEIEEQ